MENLHVHNLLDNAGIVLLQEVQKASGNDVHYMVEQTTGCSESNAIFAGKKTSTQQDWIGQVNTMLTTSASRLEGLCLLRAIVGQCSEETFLKHSVTWSRLLISFFQPHQSPPVIEASAAILIEVFRWASQLPDVARELATGHIPAFLKTLVNCDAEWTAPSLRLLSACMRCFPGPCATVSYILEDFIIAHLTNGLPHLARLSQQCLPLLARLGGGGSGGVKHREAFLELVNRLLHTLRMKLADLYTDFLSDLDDPKTSNSDVEPLRLPKVPTEEPKRTFQLTNHIETLCCCLQYMLSEHFPEGTMVPSKDILDFISKALDVTCNSVASHVTMENSMLAFVIPRIHQAAIQTLTSVIKSCCANHYNDRINQMYINILGWTNEKRLHFSALRSTTYASIVQWLEAAGASSGLAEQAGDKLVGWCISDASPVSVTTKLAASVQMKSDKKGGKLKVKGQTGESKEDPPLRETMVYASQRLCVAALKALRHLVLTGGMKLKTNSYEDMSKFVTAQLVRIQSSSSEELSAPYSDPDCRRCLYSVLLAEVLVPHPQASSVTKLAVGIFRKGKTDASLKVSSTCTEAALICNAIIHPRTPAVPRPSTSPLLLSLGSSLEAATPQTPAAAFSLSSTLASAADTPPKLPDPAIPSSPQSSRSPPGNSFGRSASTSAGSSGEKMTVEGKSKDPEVPQTEEGSEELVEEMTEKDKGEEEEEEQQQEDEEEEDEEEEKTRDVMEDDEGDKVSGKEEGSGSVLIIGLSEEELIPGTRKRKHADSETQTKKMTSEEAVFMISSFVDAPPDSD